MNKARMIPSAAIGLVVAAAALAVVLLAGCDLEGTYKYSDTVMETKAMPLSGIETLETRCGSADITVVTKEGSEAEFIVKRTYKASEREYGEKLLQDVVITIRKEGSRLILEREEKHKITPGKVFNGFVSVEITATIPARIGLDVLTGSGDLEVDDRTGHILVRSGSGDAHIGKAAGGLDIKTGSGDLRLRSAVGRVTVSCGSGDFFATDIEGGVEASSGSGDISIEKLVGDGGFSTGSGEISVASSKGNVGAKSGSGDLEFRGHTGSADLTTSSGDILFGVSSSEGEISLRTSSGDVSVTLYGVTSMELDVSTASGTIQTQVPIVVREATRRRLLGVAGDGRLKLKIGTASGEVMVAGGSV